MFVLFLFIIDKLKFKVRKGIAWIFLRKTFPDDKVQINGFIFKGRRSPYYNLIRLNIVLKAYTSITAFSNFINHKKKFIIRRL